MEIQVDRLLLQCHSFNIAIEAVSIHIDAIICS